MPWIEHTTNDMPKFKDQEPIQFIVPEGDYILCVTGFEIGISNGNKTRGSEQYEMKCLVEGNNSHCFDIMTDHESCDWRIDLFLKATGEAQQLAKNEEYSFNQKAAAEQSIKWINPIGLRFHAHLTIEEYRKASDSPTAKPRQKNRIATFYTDRGILPRAEIEPEVDNTPF